MEANFCRLCIRLNRSMARTLISSTLPRKVVYSDSAFKLDISSVERCS